VNTNLATFLTAGLLVRRPYAVLLRLDGETTDRIHEPLTLDEAAAFLRSIASDETVARAEIVPRASQTIVRLGHLN
jgi:acyl-coenzyme A thioesterase PaaI-like protein